MNKAFYWLAAVIIIVLIFAGLSLSREQSDTGSTDTDTTKEDNPPQNNTVPDTTEESTSTSTANQEVVYDGNAFSPSSLTIEVGQSVTFTNKSSSLMWVGSDPHPSHTGLAGFDANKGIGKDQSYTFTFTKTGTFGYHNHLAASDTGTIVVQ